MNESFYKDLKLTNNFSDFTNSSIYKNVPDTWYVVVSDIISSTKAIEKGKYKEVNMVGALSIISILNINKKLDLPFIFGGDGSFLLIPKSLVNDTKQALLGVQDLAKSSYGLDLRVGIVPVKTIYENDKQLFIAKHEVSKDYHQAIIKGGGLEFADSLLKKDDTFFVKEQRDKNFNLDINGLECRWKSVKTPKDENLTLLIKAESESDYIDILNNLDLILGDKKSRNPITNDKLILSFKDKNLNREASLYSKNRLLRFLIIQKLKFINLLGNFLMNNKIAKWASYKSRVVSTTDNLKFDDMLRMVVATSFEQTKNLEEYLEKEFEKGKLKYGLHKSKESLMTCLIFQRHGKHIHFVDGSKGGYALAAKALKAKK